ncbi:uncharacterized protein LOC143881940 [Tasmannia lanceolata]|uniref:uncharacterized protein LOC143881940 n=1 Tax=Tasmannia lanceolata TaxID=3420 RepID=UPI004064B7B7
MEVYVDDMLVKSQSVQDHVSDLNETFQVLREHNMKLNPTKCTFGVSSGKFLGFMVSRRGIEANPEKIKAVVELTPPKTIREVQWLTGMSEPREELLLYLSVSPLALAAVLIREEHNQQKLIYYVRKVLHDAEIKYQRVEKLAYALIMAARKVRPYFQAHTIKVLTDQPLRQLLRRPDSSGRLVKWAVELSKFDIQYLPRPAIKAQVLADFVAECTIPQQSIESEVAQTPFVENATITGERIQAETEPVRTKNIPVLAEQIPSSNEPLWEVYVDGSSNKVGCGADLVLIGPDNFVLDYVLRFGFRASNNELVTNQIQGVYEARDERMIKYLSKVRQLAGKFKNFEVIKIPRTENAKADVLSKLATSGYTTLGSICMEFLKKSSIENEAVEVMQVEHEPCWMDEIIDYLRSGKLPEAKKEARIVTQRAARFSLDGESPYKRSYTIPYLKCLRPSNAVYTLQETHEGICGEHLGARYWPQSTAKRPVLANLEARRSGPGQKVREMSKVLSHHPSTYCVHGPNHQPAPFRSMGDGHLRPLSACLRET